MSVAAPPPKPVHVHLDAATHTYYADGQVVPGVTNTLKEAKIVDYSTIPQDVLQAAAWRGTLVHRALHWWALGTLDMDSLDPAIAGYVAAGIRFHEESRFEIANVEQMVYESTYGYAGTFDLDGLIGNDLWLVDYKTGLILPGHALQLAAYLKCRRSPRRYRYAVVKLNADGTYRVHEAGQSGVLRHANFQRDLEIFLAALACAKWRLEHHVTDKAEQ
jgi:hypothetical protein